MSLEVHAYRSALCPWVPPTPGGKKPHIALCNQSKNNPLVATQGQELERKTKLGLKMKAH